jgi:hypothetical protein
MTFRIFSKSRNIWKAFEILQVHNASEHLQQSSLQLTIRAWGEPFHPLPSEGPDRPLIPGSNKVYSASWSGQIAAAYRECRRWERAFQAGSCSLQLRQGDDLTIVLSILWH